MSLTLLETPKTDFLISRPISHPIYPYLYILQIPYLPLCNDCTFSYQYTSEIYCIKFELNFGAVA